jgi:arabinofuranosyltransferase
MDDTQPTDRSARWLWVILPVAAVMLFAGWWTFRFLCDDAYIAFRYIGNRHLGWGYTWNPPPFRPVEGYTSFLWVALLDVIWTITGQDPPATANRVSLVFAAGSVALTAAMAWSSAGRAWMGARAGMVALVLWGVLTNRTFLTWTTSGLETPLFVFLVLLWTWIALYARRGAVWPFALMGTTALVALTRPDGLLYMAAALVMFAAEAWRRGPKWRDLVGLTPLLLIVAHLLWRHATYGAWLPNTYYAKTLGAWWPRAGLTYLALFALQYMWWLWLPVAWKAWRTRRTQGPYNLREHAASIVAVLTLMAEIAYYTVVTGGDHFEFRVFAHLPPLLFVALAVLADRAQITRARQVVMFVSFTAAGWILPWTDWASQRAVTDRDHIFRLDTRIEGTLWPLWPYVWVAEEFQSWLVNQSICAPWQTHKWFAISQAGMMPSRADSLEFAGPDDWAEDASGPTAFPVTVVSSVGVIGWRLPYVAVIDELGLNDYVVARTPIPPDRAWRMAHTRRPPAGYTACFAPDVTATEGPKLKDRKAEVTADSIRTCEDLWWGKTDRGELPKKPAKAD